MSDNVSPDRATAVIMARLVMFIVFIGSGISLVLLLTGSSAAVPVCLGSGFFALIALLIGAYYVARAKA